LSLLLLVVRVQSLDFGNYDITWDLPIPTRSTFVAPVSVTKNADTETTSAYLLSPDFVPDIDNSIMTTVPASSELTIRDETTFMPAQSFAFALTTSSPNSFVSKTESETTLSVSDNYSVKVPSASSVVTTHFSTVVPSSNPPVDKIAPLSSAILKRSATSAPLDDNLAELSKLESELSVSDNLSQSSSDIRSNVTLEDVVYDILTLEDEVNAFNISANSTNSNQHNSGNIWNKTAVFLSTPDGFAFFVTILVLGQQLFFSPFINTTSGDIKVFAPFKCYTVLIYNGAGSNHVFG